MEDFAKGVDVNGGEGVYFKLVFRRVWGGSKYLYAEMGCMNLVLIKSVLGKLL